MNCGKCRNSLRLKDKFCPECGGTVIRNITARIVFCPNTIKNDIRTIEPCGEEINELKKFCTQCGWRINETCFQSGAKMCSGEQNGAPCNNIVTPDKQLCSQCGKDLNSAPVTQEGK